MHVITRMRRAFEVYMLTPPEPDTYARRFLHFVQPTHTVTCAQLQPKKCAYVHPDPKSSSHHAFNAHPPSISDGERHTMLTCMPCKCEISSFEPTHTRFAPTSLTPRNPVHFVLTKSLKFWRARPFPVLNALEPPSAPKLTCDTLRCLSTITFITISAKM